MHNFFDYLFWRGDISFASSPFNEVDSLLLCLISYLDYSGIVDPDFSTEGTPFSLVAQKMRSLPDFEARHDLGKVINAATMDVMLRAAETERFGNLRLSAYVNILDPGREEQFSAVTFSNPGEWSAVIYRGTDSTVVGWKEDFNLGCMDTVPAQKDALSYLEKAGESLPGKLIVSGHSKGGNLAVYASSHCKSGFKSRIISVYNNDGPGFKKEFFSSQDFLSIKDRVHTFVPELSIVGMLFSHPDEYQVVKSDEKGVMQHDPFSWHVGPRHFEVVPETSHSSKVIGESINTWIQDLSAEQRELFIETIFGVLKDADITKNSQLASNPLETIPRLISATKKLDQATKTAVFKTVHLLVKTTVETFSRNS